MTSATPQGKNWLRFAQLVVSSSTGAKGLVVSSSTEAGQAPLRFRFEVRAADVDTPNSLLARVYNLSPDTANSIIKEFDTVSLMAGYQYGGQGEIFKGTVRQYRRGRESATESYLDIIAADGDLARNFSTVNTSTSAGETDGQKLVQIAAGMNNIPTAKTAEGYLTTGGIIPSQRGSVMYGMARDYARDLAKKHNCRWSIQSGVLTLIPNDSYLPGNQVFVLNAQTGMLGTPESTEGGITVRCYLNPLIEIGRLVQIANSDINQTTFAPGNTAQLGVPYKSIYLPATTSDAGYYRVLAVDHVGDTRGQDWYSELTCLLADLSSKTVPTN